MKPLLNGKRGGVIIIRGHEIIMPEKDKTLRDHKDVAKEFYSYFKSIVSSQTSQASPKKIYN